MRKENKTQEAWVLRFPSYSKKSKRITKELQETPRNSEDPKIFTRFQKNLKDSKNNSKNLKDFKKIQTTPKDSKKSKRFQKIPKDSKRFRKIPKDSKRIQNILKASKRF